VPVLETDISLATPRADERTPRPPAPGRKPQRARSTTRHGGDDRGKPHGGKENRGHSHARDNGDSRDRKGNEVWSNSGPQRRPKWRPQRGL
jgi:hypothetical protein